MKKVSKTIYLAYAKDGTLMDMDESRTELARRLGVTPHTISRALARDNCKKYARIEIEETDEESKEKQA